MPLNLKSVANGSVILTPASTATDKTITIPATDGTMVVQDSSNITSVANLTFTGTGNRITGDFSNATIANRVLLQSSTSNGQTAVGLIPNGTSTQTQLIAFNSTDPANSSYIQTLVSATEARINSGQLGTGTNLPMTFYTGGSEAMRITTDRNVGIGTISPGSILELNRAGSGAIGPNLYLENSASSATGNASRVSFGIDAGSSASSPTAYIENVKDAAGPGSSFMAFGTFGASLAERMRINSSGNLLVGDTTSYGGRINAANGAGLYGIVIRDLAANTLAMQFQNSSGTAVGSITVGASTTTYNTSSDYRLKENVRPLTGALATVAALKPCTYTWKADGSQGQGFIAHELQAVVPDCVTGTKDAVDADGKPQYQGVDTSFLVATVVAALQELKAEFDAYKLSHP